MSSIIFHSQVALLGVNDLILIWLRQIYIFNKQYVVEKVIYFK